MIGTRFDTMGGISSVVNVYRAAGLFDRYPIRYVATHADGGAVTKALIALRALATFVWLLVTGQVGLLHIHVSSRASFWRKLPFFVLAHAARRPTIVHIHSGAFHTFYDGCGKLGKALIRYVLDHASRVVVLSQTWKRWVESVSSNGHVTAIYNPVLLAADAPASPAGAAARPTVLVLGRIGKNKGSYDLLEAARRIHDEIPGLSLQMGGDGELEQMRAAAASARLADCVQLLGWVSGDAKQQAMGRARVYALPSYNEGLPMSVLEAMAAGLPVVTTPVGGIPEAVSDGVEGYLITPGDVDALADRLKRLLQDGALAARMGQAARRKIEQTFSTDVILPRIAALYGELGMGGQR
ncbi:MAG TPA: glycosyltransferase family 4 protein [Burkholderiaceae bacterium]|nr:glycosyltransferase family 4 protein [Burkholderiaceae bacterium]